MSDEFLVIVHPAGKLDGDGAAGWWTEVPSLAACSSDGQSLDEAVANTRRAIAGWFGELAVQPYRMNAHDVKVRVELAV